MNFTVNERGTADGFCLVKSAEKRTSAKGGAYLDIVLSDKSGEINGKIWDYDEDAFGVYVPGDIVKVRGLISKYNGNDQIKIERIRKAIDSDGIDPSDYVAEASYDGAAMYGEIISIAEKFKNEDLKKTVLKIYADNKEKLLYWPAAYKLHHAIRGGLLMHTLSVVRLCQSVCRIYPSVNGELLLAGAMLHDVGKVFEFDVNAVGTANGYTPEGNLIGHLVKGAMMVEKASDELGTDKNTAVLLEHMLISHHGNPEFGAAVFPSFIEADILSQLDSLDARIFEMEDEISTTDKGAFTKNMWMLDNRKLFNHGTSDVSTDAKLF